MSSSYGRGRVTRNSVGLILYLCGGWRSYKEIGEEFGWAINNETSKTAQRNVRFLEEVGLPVEWLHPPDERGGFELQLVRLPLDWVKRTTWLRRYIICKNPLNAPVVKQLKESK